jgi:DNA-binding IclR family transcriptional regulator
MERALSPVRGGTDVTPPGAAPAVSRGIAVLDALAGSENGSMTLSDLSRALGVPKSSTSAICTALELGGMVRRDDLGYSLGRKLVELGGAYLARLDQVSEFHRACLESTVFRAETLRLSTAAGIDCLCLARYEGHPAIRLTTNIGDRLPASSCAQGKALLARLDDSEIERLYHGIDELPRLTSRSRRSVPRLLKDIRLARARGYAIDEEESADSVMGLAVVVPTRGVRAPILAISVTKHKSDWNEPTRERLVDELKRVATMLGNPMATG